MSGLLVSPPTFEHHHNGLGIDNARPRVSWRFHAAEGTPIPQDWEQTQYELEVTIGNATKAVAYHVRSAHSVLVPWPAQDLDPQQSATVRVRCSGVIGTGEELLTEWSKTAVVETALLEQTAWKADFITSAARKASDGPIRPLRFRKDITLPTDRGTLSKARLYITSLGVFDAYIDGKRVSDELLAPGWTSYRHRLTYRVIDVTPLVKDGAHHTLCVEVAEGWYCGRLGFEGGHRHLYGDTLALLAQLDVSFGGQDLQTVCCSNTSWECADSAIERSEFYDGETYDATHEWQWKSPSTDADRNIWTPTTEFAWPKTRLCCPEMPPVRVTQTLEPKTIFKSPSGHTIIDFGQNLVGKILIKSMRVPRGQRVILRHAEVMEGGELGTRPLREARSEDIYVSSGEECTNWTPTFAYHGFRYVQVDGWEPSRDNISALVMHTDMKRRGHFSCSNPWINKLQDNVTWSMRGNFLSIPTDCPQRDERLGWTGDIQVFTPTASFLYDTTSFLSSWLEDVMAEQLEEGKAWTSSVTAAMTLFLGDSFPACALGWTKQSIAETMAFGTASAGNWATGLTHAHRPRIPALLEQTLCLLPMHIWSM